MAERQQTIDALREGKTPYFVSKGTSDVVNYLEDVFNLIFCAGAKREEELKEKFDNLKKDGRLEKYMAKKRKHNSQRDRKYMPTQ